MARTFAALQPPPAADDLRDTATTALSHAQDAVAQSWIATRRHDRHQVQDALNAVTAAGKELDTVHRQLAPGAPQ